MEGLFGKLSAGLFRNVMSYIQERVLRYCYTGV